LTRFDYSGLTAKLNTRNPPVRLIAVSKGQGTAQIAHLHALGQREFGENYLDELTTKTSTLAASDIRWVFIGKLQSNKIQRIVQLAAEIQSIASVKHARYVARYAAEFGKVPYPVFVEVNLEGEASKGGIPVKEAETVCREIAASHPELDVRGLMCIPPAQYSDESARGTVPDAYCELAAIARRCGRGELSLGMSGDLDIALAAGSTCVRIGRALFGERVPLPQDQSIG